MRRDCENVKRYQDMSPEKKRELRERWHQMTPEEREQMREKWRDPSPDDRGHGDDRPNKDHRKGDDG